MHGFDSFEKLIKSACNCLLSVSQSLELEIHASKEYTFKSTPDSCFVLWALLSGVQYFVIRSTTVCFAWQNRSRTFQVSIF